MDEKFWRFLGMACRAGRLVFGSEGLERGMRSGEVVLAILSEDAGPNTQDRISRLSAHYGIPLITAGDRQTIGHWTGRDVRVTVGVVDEGFARRLMELAGMND